MSDQDSEELEVDISQLDITDEMIAERSVLDLDNLPDDMSPWMQRTIRFIDILNTYVGRIASILLIPAAVAMVYEVVARKVFIAPTPWAYDISRMTIGAMFMLGAGYGLMRGIHIRADFIYRNWQPKNQALVDLILYILFFFPGMLALFWFGAEIAADSWRYKEVSWNSPARIQIYFFKTLIPLAGGLLIIQGISECMRCWLAIREGKWLARLDDVHETDQVLMAEAEEK